MANCIMLSGGTWNPDGWCKIKRSIGPYRLATELEDAGYSTFVLDYIENFTADEIIQVLDKHLSDTLWVGFSSTFFWKVKKEYQFGNTNHNSLDEMYYDDYSNIQRVIEHIKTKSNAKIVYGGSKTPYFVGVDDNIDYYVIGNADNSIVDLTDFLSGKKQSIEHIDGKIIDSVKYPEPDVKNISTRWQNVLADEALPLELARGCIFKCKFCDYPLTGKKKGTYLRDTQQIKDDMLRMWEQHGTESYFFTDDTFNDDNDKLDALHKVMTELPFKPKFSSYLRIDLLNKYPHQAQLLTEMGLVGTFLGLETMQPESARAIGKGLHPNKVKDRLYWLHEQWNNKVNIEAGFILGLPYDTLAYFNDLLMWCLEDNNPLQAIHFYPLMLFHYKNNDELKRYASEFALNPEIYGYELNDTICNWSLPQQKLNYNLCLDISNKFNRLRQSRNKIGGFYMMTALNTGVPLEDLYKYTQSEIQMKHDIVLMNEKKINRYKAMVL